MKRVDRKVTKQVGKGRDRGRSNDSQVEVCLCSYIVCSDNSDNDVSIAGEYSQASSFLEFIDSGTHFRLTYSAATLP